MSECSCLITGFSSSEKTWLPVNENYVWLNLEAQKVAEKSHYKVYKQLTQLRKKPAIQQGDTNVAALSEQVLAFTRCPYFFRLTYWDFS
jgi:alpha-glucosidase